MSNSLRPHGLYGPWNSPGQNTGVRSLSLLQGIFPTQGSNPGLPHCRQILYQLSHQGSLGILEGVAYSFSSKSSRPRNELGSPALQADSSLTELSGKPTTDWVPYKLQKVTVFPIVKKKSPCWRCEFLPWRRKQQPTPVFLPGESHGQRSLVGYSPWGRKESDTTEATKYACTFFTVLESGSPRSRHQQIRCLVRACFLVLSQPACLPSLCVLTGQKGKGSSLRSLL